MSKKLFCSGLTLLLVASLSACTWSSKKDYDDVDSVHLLVVPPDLSSLPVPEEVMFDRKEKGTKKEKKPDSANPELAKLLLPQHKNITIKRLGQHRWLEVKAEPEQLWPQIMAFLKKLKLPTELVRPKMGFIETEWQESQPLGKEKKGFFSRLYSTERMDKFRIRLERGSRAGVTEIFVSHYLMEEMISEGGGSDVVFTKWVPRLADPEREVEMLAKLMAYLGDQSGNIKQRIREAPSGAANATAKVDDNDLWKLVIADNLERSWRRLGLSLDRINLVVEDRDRKAGIYYVRYVRNKRSLFTGLFSDDLAEGGGYFQIRAKEEDKATIVTMHDKSGDLLSSNIVEKLFKSLQRDLNR